MYSVTYYRDYPDNLPSMLPYKSLNELIRFINFYLIGTDILISKMILDEIKNHRPAATVNLNWMLDSDSLCHDGTNIHCGGDVFTIKNSTVLKLVYRHFIITMNSILIKINKHVKSERYSFYYSDNRLTKVKPYVRKMLEQIKSGKLSIRRNESVPSYTLLVIGQCSSYQDVTAKDFPIYSDKFKKIQKIFAIPDAVPVASYLPQLPMVQQSIIPQVPIQSIIPQVPIQSIIPQVELKYIIPLVTYRDIERILLYAIQTI